MNNAFESILIAALDALDAGEPVEDILGRYPAEAAELRPILQTVARIEPVRTAPLRSAQAASRREFLAAAEQKRQRPLAGRFTWPFFRRLFASAAGLALVLVLLGSVLVIASSSSLPGDLLYPMKITVAQVRLSLADDPAALRSELAQTRRAELAEMLASGRDGRVELLGFVEALTPDTLTLDGLELPLAGATGVDLVAVGDEVAVMIAVTDGTIRVLEIRLLVPGDLPIVATALPSPSPTSSPLTPTLRPTSTPATSPTQTASPSPTTTLTATSTPTSTSTPSPTASTTTPSPSSTPTATPTVTQPPAPTSPPPPTTDPGIGDETQEPEETQEPGETVEPTGTDEPDETPEPTETDEPDETPEPAETDEPEETPES